MLLESLYPSHLRVITDNTPAVLAIVKLHDLGRNIGAERILYVASSALKMKISRRHNMSRTFSFSPDLRAHQGSSFPEILSCVSGDKGC